MKEKKLHTTKALLRVCEHVNVYICFYSFHLLVLLLLLFLLFYITRKNLKKKKIERTKQ